MSWTQIKFLDRDAEDPKKLGSFVREVLTRFKLIGFIWDPAPIPANGVLVTTLDNATVTALTGFRVGMAIVVTPPAIIDDNVSVDGFVANDNSLTIRLRNHSGSPINIGASAWAVMGALI